MNSLYILDMYIYYVFVEVYVNLHVEVTKSFNFSAILTYECSDVRYYASLSPQIERRCRLRLGGVYDVTTFVSEHEVEYI